MAEVSLIKDILPIVRYKIENGRNVVTDFCGTGFLVSNYQLLTCWHVVNADEKYAAALKKDDEYILFDLSNIEQILNTDLAKANVGIKKTIRFLFEPENIPYGTSVFTFGYPLTNKERLEDSKDTLIKLSPRYFEGYVTRDCYGSYGPFKKIPSYELNFSCPEGLSGAPLFKMNSTRIVGIIYGSSEAYTVHSYKETKEKGGLEKTIEERNIIFFGSAHHYKTLQRLIDEELVVLPKIISKEKK